MRFRVEISRESEQNATAIFEWIEGRSSDGARRWWEAFTTVLESLTKHPESFALAPEADAFDEAIRDAIFKTRHGRLYRLLFVIRGSTVHVVTVRGAGQDLVSPDDISLPE